MFWGYNQYSSDFFLELCSGVYKNLSTNIRLFKKESRTYAATKYTEKTSPAILEQNMLFRISMIAVYK